MIPGKTVNIHRNGKITFPGTEVTVVGQGLPLANHPDQFGDLLVSFEFEKEENEPLLDDETESVEIIALDQDIVINSQRDLEIMTERRERRRKDRLIKKILLNMKREMDRERRRRREREEEEERIREETASETSSPKSDLDDREDSSRDE
jgi:hypothetical protein